MPVTTYHAAHLMVDSLPTAISDLIVYDPFASTRPGDHEIVCAGLADHVQEIIASFMGSILNAGSERDAVNEDEELNEALITLMKSWIEPKGSI